MTKSTRAESKHCVQLEEKIQRTPARLLSAAVGTALRGPKRLEGKQCFFFRAAEAGQRFRTPF